MFIKENTLHKLAAALVICLVGGLAGCQSTPTDDYQDEVKQARADLTNLQTDPKLSSLAQVAIGEAESAVRAAEASTDPETTEHLVYIANNKIELAESLATARYEENRLGSITERRKRAALEAQLADLKQKQTDRGTIFTLSDALFETGKAELKPGAKANLDRLATLLNQETNRKIAVEGHTDSTGSEEFNMALSQRRADAVKSYLVSSGGVDAQRITSEGKGEGYPVASNDTASGRQQNRRVEIVFENP